jgi:hypothetical protein
MKTNLILTLILIATALTATTVRAQSSDETAIKKVIEASGMAAAKRDINAFGACFVNSPDLYYQIMTGDQQLILAHGMENMKKMVGGYFQSVPVSAAPSTHQTSDYRVRVNGNMATATLNDIDGKENSRMQMVLEKADGTWKILTLTGTYYAAGKLMEVK